MEGCGDAESRVLGAYGRGVRNGNAKRLPSFATNYKLALTNTFFSTRKEGWCIAHSRRHRQRIDYIPSRQAHRPTAHEVNVTPLPSAPAKADSSPNMF